jgi:hypothetical protein
VGRWIFKIGHPEEFEHEVEGLDEGLPTLTDVTVTQQLVAVLVLLFKLESLRHTFTEAFQQVLRK